MDNKCEWDGKNLFLFYILQSWAVLHCWITLLLQITYIVDVVWLFPVRLFDQQHPKCSYNDSKALANLSFSLLTTNQTKTNTTIESFLCWNSCVWALHSCITSLIMFLHPWLYLILCISLNLLLSLARLKSNCKSWYSKASRAYFLINSHCIALYLHSEATMMPVAIHSQQEPLICTLTQQGLLAVAQVVVSLLLSLLIYTICVWEAVNVSMYWHP